MNEQYPKQVMPRVNGKPFRCSCGCNVFTNYEKGRYRCNSCRECYESEEAEIKENIDMANPSSARLPDVNELMAEIKIRNIMINNYKGIIERIYKSIEKGNTIDKNSEIFQEIKDAVN